MYISQPLKSRPQPFDHSDWLYELTYDGFRALARLKDGRCHLVSHNGSVFGSFSALAGNIGFSRLTRDAV